MPIQLIEKSILEELGFSQNISVIGDKFQDQLSKIYLALPMTTDINMLTITSMTSTTEIKATKGEYFPKIREVSTNFYPFLIPKTIYTGCKEGIDKFRPSCDFILWNSNEYYQLAALTFSREAPILAFQSDTGKKALGVILRPSLMKYGNYLFSSIKDYLKGNITVTLVTCNHYEYPEGSIPSIIQSLANKYNMTCIIGEDSEKNKQCFHRGEKGNHVVAMW